MKKITQSIVQINNWIRYSILTGLLIRKTLVNYLKLAAATQASLGTPESFVDYVCYQ